jgi:hypothetical protein
MNTGATEVRAKRPHLEPILESRVNQAFSVFLNALAIGRTYIRRGLAREKSRKRPEEF